jgi:dihydroorotate dehydrogenase
LQSHAQSEAGGLSGKPLMKRSTEVIRLLYSVTRGSVPIIGSGGVMDAADAYQKILAGANLVQVYTGFIYHGPGIAYEIVERLPQLLQLGGFSTVAEAVGTQS